MVEGLTRTQRLLLLVSVMSAAMLNQVDVTIVNVALPHMQGTTSASREQISWVMTSYVIALAVSMPLSGWLSERFGQKRILLVSIGGFTLFSALCGIAVSLEQLVIMRFFQGLASAATVPIAQVVMMSLYPPEQRGKAMAVFGLSFTVGPMIGPALGGLLTEAFSWHWVFLINVPVGVLCFAGILAYLKEAREEDPRPFDLFGFSLLAVAICMLQLVLDRGHQVDWFESAEICIEAGVSALALFLFVVHVSTAEHPFVRPVLFADRNFTICAFLGFSNALIVFSSMTLMPMMLAGLFNVPVFDIGLLMSPRGIGSLAAMLIAGRIIMRVDPRGLMLLGLVGLALSQFMFADYSLQSNMHIMIVAGLISGFAGGFYNVPISTVSFATLDPKYYGEASSFSMVFRTMGSAIGIASIQVITTHNEATVRSRLGEGLRPDSPIFGWALPDVDLGAVEGAGRMVREAGRQALMVAYIDSFWLVAVLSIAAIPLILLTGNPNRKHTAKPPADTHFE